MNRRLFIGAVVAAGCTATTVYYVDAIAGADSNSGTAPTSAWQTLKHVADAGVPAGSDVRWKLPTGSWIQAPPWNGLLAQYSAGYAGQQLGPMAQWNDISGNGQHLAQGTINRQPILVIDPMTGRPAVAFNADDLNQIEHLSFPAGLSYNRNNVCLLMASRAAARNISRFYGFVVHSNNFAYLEDQKTLSLPPGNLEFWNGAAKKTGAIIPANQSVHGFNFSGGSARVFVDGADYSLPTMTSFQVSGGTLGDYVSGTPIDGWKLMAMVSELLIYSGLSVDEESKARAFLAAAAGVQQPCSKQVVFVGNSLTSGARATNGCTYPAYCLYKPTPLCGVVGYNQGLPGQTTDALASIAATTIDPLLTSGTYQKRALVFWEGRNDGYYNHKTPQQAWDATVAYCLARKAATPGLPIVLVNLLPSNGILETWRAEYNTLSLGYQACADRLADVAADPDIGIAGANNNPAWYSNDRVHPIATGYEKIAARIRPVLEEVL